jgi:hypothetical protein
MIQDVGGFALYDRLREEVDEVDEGVLIHRVNVIEIRDGKEETTGLLRHSDVELTC